MKPKFCIAFAFLILPPCFPSFSEAQPSMSVEAQLSELRRTVESLTTTVRKQEEKINQLSLEQQVGVFAVDGGAATESLKDVSLSAGSASGRGSSSFLPDIGVVVDIVGNSTESKSDEEGNDRLSVREVELVFGHDIDPYARLDVVATLSDLEDPDIEEAHVTYWGLPFGTKARIGRMHQRLGKATATHRDTLETVDEPLVVQRYLGVEGLFRTGLELSAFTPLSLTDFTQELVVGVMEGGGGEDGNLLGETRRHPTVYAHLANFLEISDATSLELGGTYLIGSQGDRIPLEEESETTQSAGDVQAYGLDLTLAHFVTPRNKLKLQSEFYFQRRSSASDFSIDGGRESLHSNPYGFYTLADYRFADRWSVGGRYDYVEPTVRELGNRSAEKAYSAYLTFFQSEFARWRVQYQRALLLNGDDDRLFLQGTFAIGVHKHTLN